MNINQWQVWIARQLSPDRTKPAPDAFYSGVWRRIRAEKAKVRAARGQRALSIEAACWRSTPMFAGLLLALMLYGWFYPPDLGIPTTSMIESFVLNEASAPSKTILTYQIMIAPHSTLTEAEP